ncbi:MAG: fumarylacetoacetate hydrolase family protein [Elusimicrobia bacterium]|nr:fumarylacetoacetate hydrolase family protein [Elusimicrobiota bacterium]
MRLATLKIAQPKTPSERLDGRLAVGSSDGKYAVPVPAETFPNLLSALEDWEKAEPRLRSIDAQLAEGRAREAIDLSHAQLLAPLPRTFGWVDGSAFIQHVILVRKARGAQPPEDLKSVPLRYQGAGDYLLGPAEDVPLVDEAHGMDFESEVAVVLDETPMGVTPEQAAGHVKLLLIMNDVSLRNLIPRELSAGFGFFQSKPASSLGPFAVTPDELGPAWKDGRVHLELRTTYNGKLFGHPNAGEMHFSFYDLIAHAARTRKLSAGTIVGSGTVSNADESVGSSCLAEKRMLEKIHSGEMKTPFMKAGDVVEIEMLRDGKSVFGKIAQKIVAA